MPQNPTRQVHALLGGGAVKNDLRYARVAFLSASADLPSV